jgi:hypothetical protein
MHIIPAIMDLAEKVKPAIVAILDGKKGVNGTGFFITSNGYILTCYHVIKMHLSANKVWIRTRDGVELEASLEENKSRCESYLDFAVLKVEGTSPFPCVPLGRDFEKGDRWCSRGYNFPLNYVDVDFKGEIIGKADRIEIGQGYDIHLRSDDPIKRGSSGSPILVERTGLVTGVTNSRPIEDGDPQFFATPIEDIFIIWPELEKLNSESTSLISMTTSFINDMDNPYMPGSPLINKTDLFVGREIKMAEIIKRINRYFDKKDGSNIVVLHGPCRSGKTSILRQLGLKFENELETIYIDLSKFISVSEPSLILKAIAECIQSDCEKKEIQMNFPSSDEFNGNPTNALIKVIKAATSVHNSKKFVLLFDESNTLGRFSEDGRKRQIIVSSLRSLVEEHTDVFFIFSFFKIHLNQDPELSRLLARASMINIDLLSRDGVRELILKPIQDHFSYEQDVPDQIIKLSGCFPCFVQQMCYEAVNWRNEKKIDIVPLSAMGEIIDMTVRGGDYQFFDLWNYLDNNERRILFAFSEILMEGSGDEASLEEIKKTLKEYQYPLYVDDFPNALAHLKEVGLIRGQNSDFHLHALIIKYWIDKKPFTVLFPEVNNNITGDGF